MVTFSSTNVSTNAPRSKKQQGEEQQIQIKAKNFEEPVGCELFQYDIFGNYASGNRRQKISYPFYDHMRKDNQHDSIQKSKGFLSANKAALFAVSPKMVPHTDAFQTIRKIPPRRRSTEPG